MRRTSSTLCASLPALDRLLAQADRQRQAVRRRLLEAQHGLQELEVVVLEQRAVDVRAAVDQRLRRLPRVGQPGADLAQQHLRQRPPVDVVLERPVATVHGLGPRPDEVGVVDVDLDLGVVPGAQAPELHLQLVDAGADAAGESVDLADLSRLAHRRRRGEVDGLDLPAPHRRASQAQRHARKGHQQHDERQRPHQRCGREAGDEDALQLLEKRSELHRGFPDCGQGMPAHAQAL
jgi:hypothetical protein